MLKLYNFHASSTSYRTRIVLNLKGLSYEYIPIRLDRAEHLGAAYGEINPMRGVPTLEVDGVRLYQSGAIIEYLEEVYPDPPLLPKDAAGRAQVRALADIVGSRHAPGEQSAHPQFHPRHLQTGCRRRERLDSPLEQSGFRGHRDHAAQDKKRRGFCYGAGPTIADAYLVSHVFSAVRFKTDMSPYPEIRAVIETCTALKPFADAHPSKQPDAQG